MSDNPATHRYAIIDVETTGGSFHRDKVIEIGIVLMDDDKIIGNYQSLIHPERSIPYQITGLTGIHDEMVENAPKFYEIAHEIIRLTEGRIFVAHNARFDYSFIKAEFESLGYIYTRKILDTVKLARMTFPGHRSYSLSNLISRLGLPMENRHRALDDAQATALLFQMIIQSGTFLGTTDDYIRMAIKESYLPPSITIDDVLNIPSENGVYFFYNKDTLIYVGKSKNIKSRIAQHFSDTTKKSSILRQSTTRIDYETTPNELAALINESVYIKKYKPVHNKAQRNSSYPYILCINPAKDQRLEPYIKKVSLKSDEDIILKYFSHKRLAENYVFHLLEKFYQYLVKNELPEEKIQLLIDIYSDLSADFESKDLTFYNNHYQAFLMSVAPVFEKDMIILDKSEDKKSERWVSLIKGGRFYGHAILDCTLGISHVDSIIDTINGIDYTPELDLIVHNYLRKYPAKFTLIDITNPFEK